MKPLYSLFASALLLAPALVSCQHVAKGGGSEVPPGQVWLTRAEMAASKIEVASVTEQVVDDTILTAGTVMLDDLRAGHVFSPVTGRVTKIHVRLGDHVKKGDLLASIESPDVGNAVSDVHKAEADLIAAKHDLTRKRELYAQKAAAAADVEASEDNERKAKAELDRARLKQYLLRVGNVDTVSQQYTIAAPIDGEVLAWNVSLGMEVQGQYSGGANAPSTGSPAGTTNPGELFTIGEVDKVWVIGDIYEIDIPRVRAGESVQVMTVAYPGVPFPGTVDWLSGALDANTRTAKVRCVIDNPDKKLRPMMYSTISIAVDQRKAVAIPRTAIVKMGEYKVIFIQVGEADGRVHFKRLPVEVDESRVGPFVAVKHGATAGQEIVVIGGDELKKKL
jgi:cobalt-zinc-cadmium efflux system membrane fusion protein